MKILAFDPGTKLGWAVKDGTKPVSRSGTTNFATKRHEGGGMRFLRMEQFIQTLLEENKPDVVVFEEVRRHVGTAAAHVYGGVTAAIMKQCEIHKTPYQSVPVAQIKKHWTGAGNAKKERMIEVATDLGYAPVDDNEADAIAIAHYGSDHF